MSQAGLLAGALAALAAAPVGVAWAVSRHDQDHIDTPPQAQTSPLADYDGGTIRPMADDEHFGERLGNVERALLALLAGNDTTHAALHRIENQLTTESADQAHLDADVAALQAAVQSLTASNAALTQSNTDIQNGVTALAAAIAALQAQPGAEALDFSDADAAIAAVTAAATATATAAAGEAADDTAIMVLATPAVPPAAPVVGS